MTIFNKLAKRFGLTSNQQAYLERFNAFELGETFSGPAVSVRTGLQQTTVYTACKIIADTVSMTPLGVFQYMDNGGRQVVRTHPVSKILSFQANQDNTSNRWF